MLMSSGLWASERNQLSDGCMLYIRVAMVFLESIPTLIAMPMVIFKGER